jgi:hypothetical protein
MDGTGKQLKRTVPLDQIKVISDPEHPGPQPPHAKKEYVIDKILNHRESKDDDGGLEYLVSWKGYTKPTWCHERDFIDVAVIDTYFKKKFEDSTSRRSPRISTTSAGIVQMSLARRCLLSSSNSH